MNPSLLHCGRRPNEKDIQALSEFLQSATPNETRLHRLLEAHPTIIGALGYIEFVSEFPLSKKDSNNQWVDDAMRRDRADILAARLDIAGDLRAKKMANVIELKGARTRVLQARTGRRSRDLNQAINQAEAYSGWLTEGEVNRQHLIRFGWEVWQPSKTVIMGSRDEFDSPGQLEKLKQELLEHNGVRLILTEELLALAEFARQSPRWESGPMSWEALIGSGASNSLHASLIVASGGLAGPMLARKRISGSLTSYGNVDVQEGVPNGLVHLDELRLQPLARKLEIPHADAVVGFNEFRRDGYKVYGVVKSGIVVADFNAQAMKSAFETREVRNQTRREKAMQKRRAKRNAHSQNFARHICDMFPNLATTTANSIATHATEPNSGRVGTNPALRQKVAVWLAVAAYAAYDYLGFTSREEAHLHEHQVRALLKVWGGPESNRF